VSTEAGPPHSPGEHQRLMAAVHGRVQGVGFRWWTRSRALELGLVGHATNLADGRVEVVAEGPRHALEALLALLDGPASPGRPGRVEHVGAQWMSTRGAGPGFVER